MTKKENIEKIKNIMSEIKDNSDYFWNKFFKRYSNPLDTLNAETLTKILKELKSIKKKFILIESFI